LVQMNGLGSVLLAAMLARMASSNAWVLVNTPRWRRRRVSRANQHSTRLSHRSSADERSAS
jgi:hypothetical protein